MIHGRLEPSQQPVERRRELAQLVVYRWRNQPALGVALVDAAHLLGHPCQRLQRLSSDHPATDPRRDERHDDTERHRQNHFGVLGAQHPERSHDGSDISVAGVIDHLAQYPKLAGLRCNTSNTGGREPGRQECAIEGQTPDLEDPAVRCHQYEGPVWNGEFHAGLRGGRLERVPLAELRSHEAVKRRQRAGKIVVEALQREAGLRERSGNGTRDQHNDHDAAVPEGQARAD